MFCSECGAQATGKFCWSCGKPLVERGRAAVPLERNEPQPPIDWQSLANVDTLLRIPEVRDRIARHAALSKKRLTGEEFLEHCDKFLAPLTGGVPLTLISKLTQPLSIRLGLKTGKTRTERVAQPPGAVIVAVLSSLAKNGNALCEVTQSVNSCSLRAAAPSDVWSFQGSLHIDIRADGNSTLVEAAYTVPGQLFDWGKSSRGLDQLFSDITALAKAA